MTNFNDARAYIERKISDGNDPRVNLFNDMVSFMQAISDNDYETAEVAIERFVHDNPNDLYQEVGKVTRKLHDAVRGFRDSIDPRIKEIATSDMPDTADKLQMVIAKTEEAANRTMGIVEKYLLNMDVLTGHLAKVEGPAETVAYLKGFGSRLDEDMTTILTTQSFQDLTGQTIKKVIKLVGEIEGELVKLVTTFGSQEETSASSTTESSNAAETVSQADVDDLLKNLGF